MAIRIQITIVLVIIFQVQGIGPNPLFTILTLDMIAANDIHVYLLGLRPCIIFITIRFEHIMLVRFRFHDS